MKKLYYGWWVVIGCTTLALVNSFIIYGFTAFVKPLADDLHWSYLAISFAISLRNAELGLAAPLLGFIADRIGPGKLAFVGGIVCGIGFLLLSQTNTLGLFYAAFIILSLGLSGLGQVVTTTAVVGWFKGKKLGYATGIALSGYGLGGIFLPITVWLVITYGWRTGLIVLGLSTTLIIVLSSLILWRKPGQANILQNETTAISKSIQWREQNAHTSYRELNVKQALKTRVFWVISTIIAAQSLAFQTMVVHIMPFCLNKNISNETASLIAMAFSLSTVIGRLGGAWVANHFRYIHIFIANLLLISTSFAILSIGQSLWHFAAAILLFGPAVGCGLVLRAIAIREYFGIKAFGSIQGLSIGIMTIGGIIGPSYAGYIFDIEGSYEVAWLTIAAFLFIEALIMMAISRNIRK